jgi:hypothetical protein
MARGHPESIIFFMVDSDWERRTFEMSSGKEVELGRIKWMMISYLP